MEVEDEDEGTPPRQPPPSVTPLLPEPGVYPRCPELRLAFLLPFEKLESNIWERSGVARLTPLDLPDETLTLTDGDKAVGVGIPTGVALPGVANCALLMLPGVVAGVDITDPLGDDEDDDGLYIELLLP